MKKKEIYPSLKPKSYHGFIEITISYSRDDFLLVFPFFFRVIFSFIPSADQETNERGNVKIKKKVSFKKIG